LTTYFEEPEDEIKRETTDNVVTNMLGKKKMANHGIKNVYNNYCIV
jgi:hypothetical protein